MLSPAYWQQANDALQGRTIEHGSSPVAATGPQLRAGRPAPGGHAMSDRPTVTAALITLDELKRHGWQYERQLYIELGREFSTLVMLAAVAWVASRSRREWFAAFALMFGVWDVFFYAFLYVAIGWP